VRLEIRLFFSSAPVFAPALCSRSKAHQKPSRDANICPVLLFDLPADVPARKNNSLMPYVLPLTADEFSRTRSREVQVDRITYTSITYNSQPLSQMEIVGSLKEALT
jgi:hypothetical protein